MRLTKAYVRDGIRVSFGWLVMPQPAAESRSNTHQEIRHDFQASQLRRSRRSAGRRFGADRGQCGRHPEDEGRLHQGKRHDVGCEDEHLRPEEVIRVHFREMGGEAMDASPSVVFCISAVKMSMRRLGSGNPIRTSANRAGTYVQSTLKRFSGCGARSSRRCLHSWNRR